MVIASVNAGGHKRVRGCLGGRCGSGSGSSGNKPAPFRAAMPRKEDPVCDPIVKQLSLSRDKIGDLNNEFWVFSSKFYGLMTGNGEVMSNEGKKSERHDSNLKEMQELLKLNPEAIPRLREIKTESIDLKENHLGIWEYLLKSECSTEGLEYLSPEEMKRRGHFFDWYDENGVDILRRK
ncbi:hypothetical protein BASA81_018051 [Batrachochytrium salamandrivorans]|nr:hypothetical protein BASA81_018051 [Batrachochytrium salamandrivorans]